MQCTVWSAVVCVRVCVWDCIGRRSLAASEETSEEMRVETGRRETTLKADEEEEAGTGERGDRSRSGTHKRAGLADAVQF